MAIVEETEISESSKACLCPSAKAEEGAILIGIVQSDGTVGIVGRPLSVDSEFLEAAGKGRALEKRFRFSAPCVKSDCRQWADGRCGVIDRVIAAIPPEADTSLQSCGIRASCRWFHQAGAQACAVCPQVVTDTTESC